MPTGTMETFNVPRDLLDNIQDVVGRNTLITMATMVQYEFKPDKMDHRVLVLTNYRVLLLTSKIPCKVELSTSFINIHSLESKSPSKLTIALEGRRLNFNIADEKKIDKFIIHIVDSLATAFPKVDTDQLIGQIEVLPTSRHYHTGVREVRGRQDKRDPGPCGGFSQSYQFMCDYHGLPYMADVIWDIDTIYMTQDCRELCLSDFDHLDSRHLLPIVSALEYNHWFTSLNANNVKLHPEVLNCIPTVMRKNSTLEQLHLSGIGLKTEFIQRLSITVSSNPASSLVHLDLSGNPIEDRGISHLCSCLTRLPKGLTHLVLSQTGLTAKGVNRLAESLCGNSHIADTLTVLNLARNSFRSDDVTNLFNFLAQPNALTTLDLSGTDCNLDSIFGALLRGSCQKLEHLDLSHNAYLTKKVTSVQQSCKQFFGSAISLRYVNLSCCRLPGEAVKFLLLGLGSNPIAKDVEVNLSGNNLGQEVPTLEMCVPDISNITTLDLSDNAFDVSLLSLIPKLGKNKCVKKLLLGKNFGNIKSRNLTQILEFLTAMIHEENSILESLSLAGSKLRAHTNIFINSLGGNSSLKEVDISGNLMGDAGARMLAKALQINTTLTTISWDHNGTSPQGFSDVADALEKNYSLKKMPLPLVDITSAMRSNQEKTEHAIQKIESILQRNHSPRKFASDQGYRLQQGFLISALQQMLDRAILTLQATAKKLEDKNDGSDDVLEDLSQANFLIKDAGTSRHLLAKFQDIALKSERDDSALYTQLRTTADDLQSSLEVQVKKNMSDMLSCAADECPTLLEDDELTKSVETECREKSRLPLHFTQGLVVDQLGTDFSNKLGELNLGVATHMSDQLIEGVLRALNTNHEKLLEHLRAVKAAERASDGSESQTSVLRKKSSVDDELSSLDVLSIANVKRKSVYSRKLRPQSSLVDDEDDDDEVYEPRSEGTDSTDLSQPTSTVTSPLSSRESTPSRGSPVRGSPAHKVTLHPAKKSEDKDKISMEKSSSLDKSSADKSSVDKKSSAVKTLDKKSPDKKSTDKKSSDKSVVAPVTSLNVSVDSGAPKLEHLAKARPRPPRTRAVTRAGVKTDIVEGSGLEPSHDDVSDFFDTKEIPHEVVVTSAGDGKKVTSPTNDDSKQDKKKGWFLKPEAKGLSSLFSGKKSQSTRNPETTSKKLQSPQKLTGVVEGEDVTTVTTRSHSPDTELDRKSGDEVEAEPEPEEQKPKRIPGMPMGGMGGMMGGMMAEMQAKRRSMQPLSSKAKAPASEVPRETVAPAKAPPGGRPLFPPGGASQPTAKGSEDKPKPAPLRPRPPLVPPKPSRNSVSPNTTRRSDINSSTATSTASPAPTSSSAANSLATNSAAPATAAAHKHKVTATISADKGSNSGVANKPAEPKTSSSEDGQPGDSKSKGTEPKSNGSAVDGEKKEEFLMYL